MRVKTTIITQSNVNFKEHNYKMKRAADCGSAGKLAALGDTFDTIHSLIKNLLQIRVFSTQFKFCKKREDKSKNCRFNRFYEWKRS